MRYTAPLVAALAATATARATERSTKTFKLEVAPGETIDVTEEEKFQMIDDGEHFFDITEFQDFVPPTNARLASNSSSFPDEIKHRCNVEKIIEKVSIDKIKEQLTEFSSFHNRYFNSQYGVEAAEWLYEQVQNVIGESGHSLATARLVKHQAWSQPSIIVSIPGNVRLQTVVVGAHLDSVIEGDRGSGRAPGADDNGSGSIMLLNILGALLEDPRIAEGDHDNTIEFHWYAAEETGLLGSQDIFNTYSTLGIEVEAMLNQDMVGYKGQDGNQRFGLITDNTDPDQNEFMKVLIEEYTDIPYEEAECGYACSDHAPAHRNGFPASFVFENVFGNHNPTIHTPDDTIENVHFDQVEQHIKLTAGFLYETAHHDFVGA